MAKSSSLVVYLVSIFMLISCVVAILMDKYWFMINTCLCGIFLLLVCTLTNVIGSEVDLISSEGRAVLITGCDSGFGWELARRLDDVGFMVFAGCLRPNEGGGLKLKQQSCGRIFVYHLDVTDMESVNQSLKTVESLLNTHVLWSIVNNAGIAEQSLIEFCPMESFTNHLQVNTLGPIRMCKTFLPLLRRSRGRIINVASMAGRFAPWCLGAYSTSKYGLLGFTDALRQELNQFSIKVISIEPCRYKTGMTDAETAIALNKQYWHDSNDDIKGFYGEQFYKSVLRLYKQRYMLGCDEVTPVINDMIDAIISYSPKSQYVSAPVWGRFVYFWVGLLPHWLLDKISMKNAPDEQVIAAQVDDTL